MGATGQDALSDVLRLIRIRACVYFLSDFAAPWGMEMGSNPVAQFHLVVRGQCWLTLAGDRRLLSAGDIVVLPFGDAHALSDKPGSETLPGQQVLAAIQEGTPLFMNGGESTRLLCGHFEFDRSARHPLIEELPKLVHVRGMDRQQPGWLDMVVSILAGETHAGGPGADTIAERLAEVLFIQVLRTFLLEEQQAQGFLAAVADARISTALKVIHTQASHDIGLEDIAKAAGMSRSSLAARFKELVGLTPMSYVTSWRMMQAREMLSDGQGSLAEIAERVGYTSEAAFSRAFKRQFDESPGAFRRAGAAVD